MMKRVNEFAAEICRGTPTSTLEFATFLKNWLQKHIQGTDQRYGPFLKGKGVV